MPIHIFYIDDEAELCSVFKENLSSSEYLISTYTDPENALLAIQQKKPDVVFLDYRLPGTTGDAVAQRIKLNLTLALVTGDLDVKTQTQFQKKFSKPLPWSEIECFLKELNQGK